MSVYVCVCLCMYACMHACKYGMYGMCMACVWHVYGMYMACIWHVYRDLVGILWFPWFSTFYICLLTKNGMQWWFFMVIFKDDSMVSCQFGAKDPCGATVFRVSQRHDTLFRFKLVCYQWNLVFLPTNCNN